MVLYSSLNKEAVAWSLAEESIQTLESKLERWITSLQERDGSVGSPSIFFLPQIENDCLWAKTIGLHMEKAASSVPP